ncbi:MAG: hypothetical protein FWF33_08060, partial [Clostridiales bacterium]|nr:hypothetical protein [Clostridiales bacterium]
DSDDGIRNAKFEITAYLGPGNLLVYRPEQDAGLAALAEAGSREQGYALVRIGQDYRVTETSYTGDGRLACVIETKMGGPSGNARARFDLPIPAPYAAEAAAMAAAAAFPAGVSLADAAEALRGLRVTPHRLQPIPAGDILVIDDTYNASPDSMRSGFAALAQLPAARRIAVLADMNELGEDSAALHFSVGEAARAAGFDAVYTTGEKAREIAAGAGRADLWFPDKEQLVRALFADRRPGDVYYVKGSRSMKMEEAVDLLAGGKGPVV